MAAPVFQLTLDEIRAIVAEVECPPYAFRLSQYDDNPFRLWLRVVQSSRCAHDGTPSMVEGRAFVLSRFHVRSEIVQTCLLACLVFAEHEIREFFRYRGRPVFNPHIDIEALASVCETQERR